MPIQHKVKPGDCIDSIAFENGFFPDTVWKDSANAELRRLRGDPNILFTGDIVVIPDKKPRTEDRAAEARHRFRLRGVPARFRLQLFHDGRPRANVPFRIDIDGALQSGTTDANGVLDISLPNNARRGLLCVDDDDREIELRFGHLAPVAEDLGVRQRLANLGFLADPRQASEEELEAALIDFQADFSLIETGRADEATRNKLVEIHDYTNTMPQEQFVEESTDEGLSDEDFSQEEPPEESVPPPGEDEPGEDEPAEDEDAAADQSASPPDAPPGGPSGPDADKDPA